MSSFSFVQLEFAAQLSDNISQFSVFFVLDFSWLIFCEFAPQLVLLRTMRLCVRHRAFETQDADPDTDTTSGLCRIVRKNPQKSRAWLIARKIMGNSYLSYLFGHLWLPTAPTPAAAICKYFPHMYIYVALPFSEECYARVSCSFPKTLAASSQRQGDKRKNIKIYFDFLWLIDFFAQINHWIFSIVMCLWKYWKWTWFMVEMHTWWNNSHGGHNWSRGK